MEIQFVETLDIPKEDFILFHALNNAPREWEEKQLFYRLKDSMLIKYGHKNGQDLQIIEKECNSCTRGIWRKGRWNEATCFHCNGTGIYTTKYVTLDRYILNDCLFHVPLSNTDKKRLCTYNNIVIGYIKHTPIAGVNHTNALDELIEKYARKLKANIPPAHPEIYNYR